MCSYQGRSLTAVATPPPPRTYSACSTCQCNFFAEYEYTSVFLAMRLGYSAYLDRYKYVYGPRLPAPKTHGPRCSCTCCTPYSYAPGPFNEEMKNVLLCDFETELTHQYTASKHV